MRHCLFVLANLLAVSGAGLAAASAAAIQAASDSTGGSAPSPSGLREALMRQEYFASENRYGLQAPNRALGVRTYFNGDGLRVVSRDTDEANLFRWRVQSLRRGRIAVELTPGVVTSHEAQVEVRQGAITQTFDNAADGLHPSIHIHAPPRGDGVLELAIDLGTGATAAGASADDLHIAANGGAAFRLDRLSAMDANGRALALAPRRVTAGALLLRIDDTQAAYPITLKAVITGAYDLRAQPDQVSAHFGTSVAAVGDINVDGIGDFAVGAPDWDGGQTDEGAVFIYYGSANFGTLDLTADKRLEIDKSGAHLGASVAAAGDVNRDNLMDVIAGAPGFDNGSINEGAAFVYSGLDILIASPILPYGQLEGGRSNAAMGSSVAGAGDVNGDGFDDVVVGAPGFQLGSTLGGRAFLFYGGFGASFDITPDATYSAAAAGAQLGASVAGAGDVNGDGRADVLVGAPGAGFVELHRGGIATTVVFDSDVLFNGLGTEFGASVAGVGDVNGDGYSDMLMSAPLYSNGQANEGGAFLFFGGAGAINMGIDAVLESNQTAAGFGTSLAGGADINGDGYADIAVGAPYFSQGETNEGRVFVYYGKAGAFPTTAGAEFQIDQVNAYFGSSVALGDIDGDGYAEVLGGAPYVDFGHSDEGAVFVYRGGGGHVDQTFDTNLGAPAGQANDYFGLSVAGAGDVNGDGYTDVIVGAPTYDGGELDEGRAYIFLGSASGLNATPYRTLEENQAGAAFGRSVAAAGDVNNDGFADVIVGAPQFDQGQTNEGSAFVYLGATNMNAVADARFESDFNGALLGWSVAGAGDVNGDGYADVIVGAPVYGPSQVGIAVIYFGGSGQLDVAADAVLQGSQTDARFGYSVAGAGDVNGDGFADVVVGAPFLDSGSADVGQFAVYFGGVGTFDTQSDARTSGAEPGEQLGYSVAGAGDVNGDGFDDVVVGAPVATSQSVLNAGKATVYFGARTSSFVSTRTLAFAQTGARFGAAVAGAGDVNRDGYADVIVGAPLFNSGGTKAGLAYVAYGGAAGGQDSSLLLLNQAGGNFGTAVAGAGDVNGDGFADVVVGAPFVDTAIAQPGLARVFLGNNQPGRTLLPQQLVDGSAPVQPWGSILNLTAFQVTLQALSPRGRERVKVELQVCPAGADFLDAAAGCRGYLSPDWSDTGTDPNGVVQVIWTDGLPAHTLYHWRARIQYAPFTADLTTSPASARSFGPWFYLQAQSDAGDVRIIPLASDTIFFDDFE